MREAWARKAATVQIPAASRAASVERLRPLIEDFLSDLDLGALLEDSPSERIHAWLRPPSGPSAGETHQPLDSVAVDPSAAIGLQRMGASLYFRAPEELERLLVSGFASALGAGFCGRYPGDGRPRGEIETFICSSGHVTGWHTDFQHNFTIQLKGSKRWRFKQGPVNHNLRALTPHYKTRSNFEEQMKMHLLSAPTSTDYRPPEAFFENAEEVIVREGSVLYHPAGIWHHVECLSDTSVSINVSLSIASWAELIGDAFLQMLWQTATLRAPALIGGPLAGTGDRETCLSQAQLLTARLSASELLPEAALDQAAAAYGGTFVARPRAGAKRSRLQAGAAATRGRRCVHLATVRFGDQSPQVTPKTRVRFSALVIAVRLAPLRREAKLTAEDSDSDTASVVESGEEGTAAQQRYALHYNFGNEDLASWSRVVLLCPATAGRNGARPEPHAAAMEWLCKRRVGACRAVEQAAEAEGLSRRGRGGSSGSGSGPTAAATMGETFAVKDLLEAAASPQAGDRDRKSLLRLVQVLLHFGYLQPGVEGSTKAISETISEAAPVSGAAAAAEGRKLRKRPAAAALA